MRPAKAELTGSKKAPRRACSPSQLPRKPRDLSSDPLPSQPLPSLAHQGLWGSPGSRQDLFNPQTFAPAPPPSAQPSPGNWGKGYGVGQPGLRPGQ